ncbi:hypothetical protein [Patulibacter defluvii]|uniref:hypothetical protein n=1 Tax=Patulibacter defluvii TaxID=3095358 RepID=UPI002A75F74D|nr:hypothetical protein [Patulibacter sp. DM4]
MSTTTLRRTAAVATCGLLLAMAPSSAGAASYRGKTSGGTSIQLSVSGKRVSGIKTLVPTSCVETTGSFGTAVGAELFQPPGSFTVGRTAKVKALQPAAMNSGTKATKNYTVTLKSAGKRAISGKLAVNFSYLRPGPSIYQSYVFICSGSARFTAKAR